MRVAGNGGKMRYESVCLKSFGFVLPPRVVTSAALEDALAPIYERFDLPAGRLEMISGVKERRFWEPNTRPSAMSIRSATEAIARSGVEKESIGALVHTSVCRDFLEPATASVVAGALDLADASADMCMANHVPEHVDDAAASAEMVRALRPGGQAVNTAPMIEGFDETYEDQKANHTPERSRRR